MGSDYEHCDCCLRHLPTIERLVRERDEANEKSIESQAALDLLAAIQREDQATIEALQKKVYALAGALRDSQETMTLLLAVLQDVSSFNLRTDSTEGLRRKVDANTRVLAALDQPEPGAEQTRR